MMASYSVFPRPEQPPPDPSAAARAHSRFVEGSMNDRVSNAPPPTFLGHDELAAYERQFYAEGSYTRSSRPASGSEQSFNRNSGSKFWEGIREKFARTKSSSSLNTISSGKSKASNRFSQQSQQAQAVASSHNEKENVTSSAYYPSREEVMENYKNLVDAGFFSSHAIQGTRHQPPPSRPGLKMDHPLPAPPLPARDTPLTPLSQLVTQKQRHLQQQNQIHDNPATPAMSSLFASIPYSATQPSPTGDAPKTTYARPDPRPPISLPKKYRRTQPSTYHMPPPPVASPSRGTKRANADMTGGFVDREMANMSTDNLAEGGGAGARKLVKKLRKSASRISADLSLRPSTNSGSASASNHPYGSLVPARSTKDVRGMSSTSVSLVPRPSTSSASRAVGSVVRSLSNSFKRHDGKTASSSNEVVPPSAPPPPPPPPPPPAAAAATKPLPTPAPNKLIKAKRSLTRRVSLSGRSRSGSISSSSVPPALPSYPPPPVPSHAPTGVPPVPPPHHHQHHRQQPSTTNYPPPSSARQSYETQPGDPMVLDPPDADVTDAESPARPSNTSFADTQHQQQYQQPGGLSVPSFHYPRRQKQQQQSVQQQHALAPVSDPNRGAPPVGGRHFKSGSFCFGTGVAAPASPGGGGLPLGMDAGYDGDWEKENGSGEFAVY